MCVYVCMCVASSRMAVVMRPRVAVDPVCGGRCNTASYRTLSVLCVSSRQTTEAEMEQMMAMSALPSKAGCRKRVSFESLSASALK